MAAAACPCARTAQRSAGSAITKEWTGNAGTRGRDHAGLDDTREELLAKAAERVDPAAAATPGAAAGLPRRGPGPGGRRPAWLPRRVLPARRRRGPDRRRAGAAGRHRGAARRARAAARRAAPPSASPRRRRLADRGRDRHRHRHRRHAVPGRLGDDGAQPARAPTSCSSCTRCSRSTADVAGRRTAPAYADNGAAEHRSGRGPRVLDPRRARRTSTTPSASRPTCAASLTTCGSPWRTSGACGPPPVTSSSCSPTAGPEEAEASELLAWLSAGHFTFLGYRCLRPGR